MIKLNNTQKRETDGKFAFDGNFDRLCVCGHTLGVHCAGSPADCLLYSFSAEDKLPGSPIMISQVNADVNCGCVKFRLSRRMRIRTTQITAVLRAAGRQASVRSKRLNRIGYQVRQVNPNCVAVISDHLPNPRKASDEFEAILVGAGFRVCRPYADSSILAVRQG